MKEIKTLKGYLEALKIGRPITHENLAVFPVTDGDAQGLAYLLLEEALAAGTLKVEEHGEATVPELLLKNDSDQMVFLMEGEALVGAKQNRTLNTSILAGANSSFTIPVSCVEQGRWAFAGRTMGHGSVTYPRMRKMKHHDVYDNLHRDGAYKSDQARIWQSVNEKLKFMKVRSVSANIEDVYKSHSATIQVSIDSLPYPSNACGVIAAIDGHIVCADLFDATQTLEKLWAGLVSSYALDALEAQRRNEYSRRRSPDRKTAIAHVSEEEAAEFLQIPEQAEIDTYPSPGLGSNVRFRHVRNSGHALIYKGQVIHAALFGAEEQRAEFQSNIRRPSQRRPIS